MDLAKSISIPDGSMVSGLDCQYKMSVAKAVEIGKMELNGYLTNVGYPLLTRQHDIEEDGYNSPINSPTRLHQKVDWFGLKGLWSQMTITDPSAWNSVFFPIYL